MIGSFAIDPDLGKNGKINSYLKTTANGKLDRSTSQNKVRSFEYIL